MQLLDLPVRLRPHLAALVPGLAAVGLMLVWAVHDGGYDAETWYWGALAALALLGGTVIGLRGQLRLSRGRLTAIGLFLGYVLWCYVSMSWARAPGEALQGANQALLYLLVFTVMLVLPWTPRAALAALVVYVGGIGVIAVVLLFRLAAADRLSGLVVEGRLASPTGYFNATAALFTAAALAAIALSTRRELPGLMRGLMLAFACGGLQLALIVQSRGWLFTLPLVALVGIIVVKDRLRVTVAVILPVAGTLAILHRLLAVYGASTPTALDHAAQGAGQPALLICAAVFVLGTLLAWADALVRRRPLPVMARRAIGTAITVLVVAVLAVGGTYATHGHPFRFISRQVNGFSHVQTSYSSLSHFVDVGSGRYDFWRVSLHAFLTHPIGGLGENNFSDYYLTHRRTGEEPSSTHSLELRFLAQTGAVGTLLITGFMIAAAIAAAKARRQRDPLAGALAGIALLPAIVWFIHGSVDWFWEIPALSGPALGFLGMAGGLKSAERATEPVSAPKAAGRRRIGRGAGALAGGAAFLAAVIVLGLPYLSRREISIAMAAAPVRPQLALADFRMAARFDPLSSVPGELAGVVALHDHLYTTAEQRFRQSAGRDPGQWFSWLGAGLAASALGKRETAYRYFRAAYAVDNRQPADAAALSQVFSKHPLTSAEAFKLLVVRN